MKKIYLLTRHSNFSNEVDCVELVFFDKEKAEQYLLNNGAKLESYKYRGKYYYHYSMTNEEDAYTTCYSIIEKEVIE